MREREREHVWACVRERERACARVCARVRACDVSPQTQPPRRFSSHYHLLPHLSQLSQTLLTVLEASGCRFQFVGVRHHVVDYGGWHQALDYGRRHVMAYRGKRTDFIFGVSHHVLALPLQVYPTHVLALPLQVYPTHDAV